MNCPKCGYKHTVMAESKGFGMFEDYFSANQTCARCCCIFRPQIMASGLPNQKNHVIVHEGLPEHLWQKEPETDDFFYRWGEQK